MKKRIELLFNNYTFPLIISLVLFNSCTEKSPKKIVERKKVDATSYCLKIESENEFSASLSTSDLYDEKHEKINLLKFDTIDTIGRSWHLQIDLHSDFKLDTVLNVRNLHEFKKKVNKCFLKVPHIAPKNANYVYENNAFEPLEAVNGNQLDTSKLNKLIFNSISTNSDHLSINYQNAYLKPGYYLSHEKSAAGLKELKKCVETKIIFKIKDEEVTMDNSIFGNWLSLDTAMKTKINQTKAGSFFRSLAKKYDEIIPSVSITSSKGELKTINGGDIGVRINVNKESNNLISDLRKGEEISREPYYSMKGLPEVVFDSKKNFVEISLSDQKLWYYKNGALIIESDIVTGCPKLGHKTPSGAFYVKYKSTNTTLKGPGYSAFVRYWMPFNNGIGLHDAQWRKSFGGSIYVGTGSHGCINLPLSTASIIYQNLSPGTIVLCY